MILTTTTESIITLSKRSTQQRRWLFWLILIPLFIIILAWVCFRRRGRSRRIGTSTQGNATVYPRNSVPQMTYMQQQHPQQQQPPPSGLYYNNANYNYPPQTTQESYVPPPYPEHEHGQGQRPAEVESQGVESQGVQSPLVLRGRGGYIPQNNNDLGYAPPPLTVSDQKHVYVAPEGPPPPAHTR